MATSSDPVLDVHELAYSHVATAALLAAVRLGVPDAIGDRPVTVDELATAVQADPRALRKLMRALVHIGVFRRNGTDAYEHCERSLTLRSDHPSDRRGQVLIAGAPFAWRMWPRLDEAVRTGESVFPAMFGKSLFEHLHEDDIATGELFHSTFSRSAAQTVDTLAELIDLGTAATIADIGAGPGQLLRALLERNAGVHGVLFDLPAVTAKCLPDLRDGGRLADRCTVVNGDVHESVPVKADVYVLKGVLHMWDDATVARALANIARHAPAGARVLIVDQVMDAGPAPRLTALMDLLMLVSQGGSERTEEEFRDLLGGAGMRLRQITPAGPVNHLIESVVSGPR